MSTYLQGVQKLVDSYKPRVEQRLGDQIEDIVVKSLYGFDIITTSLGQIRDDPIAKKYMKYSIMIPLLLVYRSLKLHEFRMTTVKGVIKVKDRPKSRLPLHSGYLHKGLMHELAHRASHIINPSQDEDSSERVTFGEFLGNLEEDLRESFRLGCISEGFAEFMALEYLADLYDVEMDIILLNLIQRRLAGVSLRSPSKYELGFKFFHEVAHETKKDGDFDLELILSIITNPDIPIDQIRNPQLFLENADRF